MKKLSFISIAVLVVSCSKTNSPVETYHTFEVYEYKTNTPVPQAQITFYKCIDYDIQFGCRLKGIAETVFTNDNGLAKVSQTTLNKSDQGIEVGKPQYWTQSAQPGRNELCREGWIQLHITRVNYSGSGWFLLYNVDERGILTNSAGKLMFSMDPVHDTTLMFRAFGGQNNTLTWKIASDPNPLPLFVYASGSLSPIQVPASTTVNAVLTY